jgi:hypothetical protein
MPQEKILAYEPRKPEGWRRPLWIADVWLLVLFLIACVFVDLNGDILGLSHLESAFYFGTVATCGVALNVLLIVLSKGWPRLIAALILILYAVALGPLLL